jgi:hypothetical protein
MKSDSFPQRLVAHLQEGSEHLPYRVTHRLDQARLQAVALAQRSVKLQVTASSFGHPAGQAAVSMGREDRPSGWLKALSVLPIVVIVIGLYSISVWDDFEKAAETADLDEAMLVDEVPIEAYADKGFGVFIKNNRE